MWFDIFSFNFSEYKSKNKNDGLRVIVETLWWRLVDAVRELLFFKIPLTYNMWTKYNDWLSVQIYKNASGFWTLYGGMKLFYFWAEVASIYLPVLSMLTMSLPIVTTCKTKNNAFRELPYAKLTPAQPSFPTLLATRILIQLIMPLKKSHFNWHDSNVRQNKPQAW